jgi:hypothetical protein
MKIDKENLTLIPLFISDLMVVIKEELGEGEIVMKYMDKIYKTEVLT